MDRFGGNRGIVEINTSPPYNKTLYSLEGAVPLDTATQYSPEIYNNFSVMGLAYKSPSGIWVATVNHRVGVFDLNMKTYDFESYNTPELISDHNRCVYSNDQGELWIEEVITED